VRAIIRATITATLTLVASAAPAQAATTIQSVRSGKCVDVYAFSHSDGAGTVQWDCWGGANQQWTLEPVPGDQHPVSDGGRFFLRAGHSNKCLEVAGFGTHDGADVVQWSCWGGANQQWALYQVSGRYGRSHYVLRNVHSGKCLDVPNWSDANGEWLQQWSCKDDWQEYWSTNQLWNLWPY
jgi:hypothetical protein